MRLYNLGKHFGGPTHQPFHETCCLPLQDALRFPLIGSAVLFSLFIVFKLFNKDLVNALLTLYFVVRTVWLVDGKTHCDEIWLHTISLVDPLISPQQLRRARTSPR